MWRFTITCNYCRSWPFLASKSTKLRLSSRRTSNVTFPESSQCRLCYRRRSWWVCGRNWNHAIITASIVWLALSGMKSRLFLTSVTSLAETTALPLSGIKSPLFSTSVCAIFTWNYSTYVFSMLVSVLSGSSAALPHSSESLSFYKLVLFIWELIHHHH